MLSTIKTVIVNIITLRVKMQRLLQYCQWESWPYW